MSSRIIPVPIFTITVFGATGDLAKRKLYPSLWQRVQAGQAPENFRLFGAARETMTDDSFRALVCDTLPTPDSPAAKKRLDNWLANARYFSLDATTSDNWQTFAAANKEAPSPQIFYFAVGPNLAGDLCQRLKESNVLSSDTRLVLEKPFGRDLASAVALNEIANQTAPERQIYRIDHYLGKETVQNLMALRFANALFEPIWNARAIDHIQITVAEDIGVGERGGYYEQAGATRDMLQNHLLQLLCLIAMEPPTCYDADSIRDEKLKVLQSLRPITPTLAKSHVVTGQYVGGNGCASYAEENNGKCNAETFVAVKCAMDNWRWAGVPFYLRTGKRLTARMSEIVVHFKSPPHSIFPSFSDLVGNQLAVRLQPMEGITLHLNIKEPGLGGFRLSDATLDMSFADSLATPLPDAYERLLMDVVRGDQTLFMRNDEVEAAWKWMETILQYTTQTKPNPYMCGSSGPDDALRLMHADGRQWRNII